MYAPATFIIVVFTCLVVTQPFEQQVPIIPERQNALENSGSRQETLTSSALRQFRYGEPGANTGFVAFGDSYSAGIGTGVDGAENDCRQGLHAHAQLIAADQKPTTFQFLSCTGATTADITSAISGSEESQIDRFKYAFQSHLFLVCTKPLSSHVPLHAPRTPKNESKF